MSAHNLECPGDTLAKLSSAQIWNPHWSEAACALQPRDERRVAASRAPIRTPASESIVSVGTRAWCVSDARSSARRRFSLGPRRGVGAGSAVRLLCARPSATRRAVRRFVFTAFAAVTAPPAPGPRALPRPRSGARVPYAATHAGRLGRRLGNGNHLNIYNPRYNRMSAHPVASQILHRHRRALATYDIVRRRSRPCTIKFPHCAHQRGSIHRPVRAARSDQTHTIRCGVCASAACVVYAQDMLPYACATPRSDACSALFVLTEPLIPHRVKAAVAVARRHHAWRQKGGDRNVRSPCSCSAEKRRLKGCELLSQLAQPRVELVLNLRHVCGVLEAHAVLHRGSKRPTDPCPSYLPHPTCFESQQPIPHILICGLEQATICHGTSMRTQYGIQVLLELRSQAIHAPPRFRRTCAEDAPRVDENGAIRHSAHRDTSR